MSNIGSPSEIPPVDMPGEELTPTDQISSGEALTTEQAGRQSPPFWLLLIALLGFVLAVFIGLEVIGVLYGVVFPAKPPLPSGVTQLSHDNLSYGVDNWVYGTEQDACEVVQFYVDEGGNCVIAPSICGVAGFEPQGTSFQQVATCTGLKDFSIFSMEWEATIFSGYRSGPPTQIGLHREVNWIGSP